jgi:hypothetical protein
VELPIVREGSRRTEVAYAKGSPDVVYALVDANKGILLGSADGGATFTTTYEHRSGIPALAATQGWYDLALWANPCDASDVIAGSVELFRSRDGGRSFSGISNGRIHPDHHVVVEHPDFDGTTNRTVWFGNDGGVWRADVTTLDGLNANYQPLNNQLAITQFYGAAGNATSGVIVGGTQDNGTLRYTPAGGPGGWNSMYGGDGGFAAADPSDPNYFYGEVQYLQLHRSTDGGRSSRFIFQGISDAGYNANFIPPFVLDPNNPGRMLAGGASLWRTDDVKAMSPSWQAIKSPIAVGFPGQQFISAIAIAPGNPDVIWVGHNNGELYQTVNGTAAAPTWIRINPSAPFPRRFITRVVVDPSSASTVYVCFGGFIDANIQKTTDGGASWSNAAGEGATKLPAAPVRDVEVARASPNSLWAATEVGVFQSTDGGVTWDVSDSGPANVSVDELFVMGDSLVAATHGRGLFRTPLPEAPPQTATVSFIAPDVAVAEDAGTVLASVRVTSSDGAPLAAAVTVDYATIAGSASEGSDYARTAGTLTFVAGTSSGSSQTITVPIVDDAIVEPDETVAAALSNASGAGIGLPSSFAITIIDNDDTPPSTPYSPAPSDGATGVSTSTSLLWRSPGATRYDIRLGTSNPPPQVSSGLASNWYIPPPLTSNTMYYWQIIARNPFGTATGPVWSFITGSSGGTVSGPTDFDGDQRSDVTVFRAASGMWYVLHSHTNNTTSAGISLGAKGDILVPGDYDGDGKADAAVYRPSNGYWSISQSSTGASISITLRWGGMSGDKPVPGDYDGDGRTDLAFYRPSVGEWKILTQTSAGWSETGTTILWGLSTDVPMPGDYDGDGKTDVAVYRPSTGGWYVLKSSTNRMTSFGVSWGLTTDVPLPGDYDGDGKIDPAVYRSSMGGWYALSSKTGYTTSIGVSWGLSSDTPVPGDFDGDGKTDVAVYRPSNGNWYILRSSDSNWTYAAYSWGLSTDIPVFEHP